MLKTVSSVANALGALNYKGTWNASTNTPALASSVGTQGDYYVVSVDGATDLDGITNWGVGDWAAFNGSVWQRVEGGADGNFVNLDVTGTATLNGAGSGNGLLKNINTGFGVGTERWIGADGTLSTWFYNVPTGGKHYIAVNNVNKLSVDGDDVNVLLGNLVIGTSGKGIDFSATAGTGTSELLADYEEGTWTPVGNGVTLTLNTTASYIKVGTLVTVFWDATWPATANASAANVTGLPFTVLAGGGSAVGYTNSGLEVHYNVGGGTTLAAYLNTAAAVTNAQMSGSRIIVSGSYTVS
jgi:hypothetical protein